MKKIVIHILLVCAIIVASYGLAAQSQLLTQGDSIVYCRISKKYPRVREFDSQQDRKIRLSDEYAHTSAQELRRLMRKGCNTYDYLVSRDSSNHYTIELKIKKAAIGLSASYMVNANVKDWIRDDFLSRFSNPSISSNRLSLAFNIYRQVFALNRHRIGLEFEIGYCQTNFALKTDSYFESFSAVDPYMVDYTREIKVSDYQETHKVQGVQIPVLLRYDWFFIKSMSIFVSSGIQNEVAIVRNSSAKFWAQYSGRYGEEYFNTYIAQNGYYDFGNYYNDDNKFTTVVKFPEKREYFLHAMIAGGFQFFWGPTVSLEIGCVYSRIVFNTCYHSNDDFHLSKTRDEYQSTLTATSKKFGGQWGGNCKLKVNF